MIEKYDRMNPEHRGRLVDILNFHYGDRWKYNKDMKDKVKRASSLSHGLDFFDPQDTEVHTRFIDKFIKTLEQDKPVWTRRDGTTLLVEDMNDGHLENSISMLKKKGYSTSHPLFMDLLKERSKRFWRYKPIDSLAVFEELGS